MLSAIALAAAVIVVFVAVFFLSIAFLDGLRLWPDAGLAALIPMSIISATAAILCSGFTLWVLTV